LMACICFFISTGYIAGEWMLWGETLPKLSGIRAGILWSGGRVSPHSARPDSDLVCHN
jgi:hypothetical protein